MQTPEELNRLRFQESPIVMERGKLIRPFMGQVDFLPVDLSEAVLNPGYNPRVLVQPIFFEGIRGSIEALADYDSEDPVKIGKANPLGPVEANLANMYGKIVVSSLPLSLQINFFPKNMSEVMSLSGTLGEFHLRMDRYYTEYSSEDDIEEAESHLHFSRYQSRLYNTSLANMVGEDCALPYNFTVLREVLFRILPRADAPQIFLENN